METDPRYELVPLLKATDIYDSFEADSMRQRIPVIDGLHHLDLNARRIRRFSLTYALDVLHYAKGVNQEPPYHTGVFRDYARTSEAFYTMQRTEQQFESALREALQHPSRPEGTVSGRQMEGIFNIGHSTMSLIITGKEIEAKNIGEHLLRPQWAVSEASVRNFYTWRRPEGYPEYPAPLEPIR